MQNDYNHIHANDNNGSSLQTGGYLTDQHSKQMELIIHNSLFSSNFCVDYDGYDIFDLWNLSGKVYLL